MLTEKQSDYKTISIAQNRQMTIPKKFYETIGLSNEAVCYVEGNAIIIKPKSAPSGEFDEYILKDLIEEGYRGQELFAKFKEIRKKIRPAFERMMEDFEEQTKDQDGRKSYKDFLS